MQILTPFRQGLERVEAHVRNIDIRLEENDRG